MLFPDAVGGLGRRTVWPRELPLFQEEGVYDVDELIQFIRKQADELAEKFDVRNGNDYYKERIAAQL